MTSTTCAGAFVTWSRSLRCRPSGRIMAPRKSPTAWRRPCCPCSVPTSSISRCPPIGASRPSKPSTSTGDGPFRWAAKQQFERALHNAWLGRPEQTGVIANPVGHGTISVASVPIGFRGDAVVIAGSRGPKFPDRHATPSARDRDQRHDRRVAAANAEMEERRFVSLVERFSDFIGIVSLDGAPHYVNPAGLHFVGLETLEQAPSTACLPIF